jgi:hypothetical protein
MDITTILEKLCGSEENTGAKKSMGKKNLPILKWVFMAYRWIHVPGFALDKIHNTYNRLKELDFQCPPS